MKVFLGGTCNGSKWRSELTELFSNSVSYFNPVVPDWTPEDQERELKERCECDYVLYVITPDMTGVYSVAEVVDDSNKRPLKTIFCVMTDSDHTEFTEDRIRSLHAVEKMVTKNGAKVLFSLQAVADFLNTI